MSSLLAREAKVAVDVKVDDFKIASPADREEIEARLPEVAREIASAVGAELAALGASSIHGVVTLKVDGVKATSEMA